VAQVGKRVSRDTYERVSQDSGTVVSATWSEDELWAKT
jgi:hypothetical protein